MKQIYKYSLYIGFLVFLLFPSIIHAEENEVVDVIEEKQNVSLDVKNGFDFDETTVYEEGKDSFIYSGKEDISIVENGSTNDELFAKYVDAQFGVEDENIEIVSNSTKSASYYGAPLEGVNAILYDLLSEEITGVAAGTIEHTVFEYLDEDLGIAGSHYYTAAELGAESLIDEKTGSLYDGIQDAYYSKIGFDLTMLNRTLLYNHPYELYWYDKTVQGAMTCSSTYSTFNQQIHLSKLKISMKVASDYSLSGQSNTNDYNVEVGTSVNYAVNNAKYIVDQYANLNDYEKLFAYKDEICNLTSYNYEAAELDNNVIYGNPWQLIWVFDKNPDTTVVCEGYAKAFSYLCSKSTFVNEHLKTYLVSGLMGTEKHMWNIVTFGFKNYLVDVTNMDSGTVGNQNKLFLVGTNQGNVEDGYTFIIGTRQIDYKYDEPTIMSYTNQQLALYTQSYIQPIQRSSHSLNLKGKIGVNFYLSFTDEILQDENAVVELTVDKKTSRFLIKDAPTDEYQGMTEHMFSIDVAPAQLSTPVTAKVLLSDGTNVYRETYSAQQYCYNKIANPSTSQKTLDMVKALLNYGSYVQLYFDYNTDNLANEGLSEDEKKVSDVTPEQLSNYAPVKTGSETGLLPTGTSIIADTTTSIRHFFMVEDGYDIEDYTFQVDGITVEPIKSGNEYYIEIANIPAAELDKMYELKVGNYTVRYGALSYAYNKLSNPESSEKVKNMCSAMYKYNVAAKAYFSN